MAVETCFDGKMSRLACVYMHRFDMMTIDQ